MASDLDLSQPDTLRRELLDDDRTVRDEFAAALADELAHLVDALAPCFARLPALHAALGAASITRNGLVAAFMFGVLDDLVVSTKLLLSGKFAAAGNLMRQVVEGIAISALCATDELLVIERHKQKGPTQARFWEKLEAGDRRTQGHRAVDLLEWNAAALGFAANAVQQLRQAKKHYNAFSHCGMLTIAGRVALEIPGQLYVGGHFDPAKLHAYQSELGSRTQLCQVLPEFMTHQIRTMQPTR